MYNCISGDRGSHHAKCSSSEGNRGQVPYANDGRKGETELGEICARKMNKLSVDIRYFCAYAKTGREYRVSTFSSS